MIEIITAYRGGLETCQIFIHDCDTDKWYHEKYNDLFLAISFLIWHRDDLITFDKYHKLVTITPNTNMQTFWYIGNQWTYDIIGTTDNEGILTIDLQSLEFCY